MKTDSVRFTALIAIFITLSAVSCAKKPAQNPDEGLTGGTLVFSEDFNNKDFGDKWINKSGKWELNNGWAHVQGDHNSGLWLNFALPDRVRVEFDAKSMSEDGDLKFEIFARAREHQTGYIVILGGWKNAISIIARLDEHGQDRIESGAKVDIGRVHHFTAIRTDNRLRWYVDGKPVLKFVDTDPIDGVYFAFNNWASDAWYDNLRIYDLQ